MLKQGGEWKTVDWTTALQYVANGLAQIKAAHGSHAIGALGSAHSTVEELHLLGKLVRGLGSDNIDHRLRHSDFSVATQADSPARWLGTSIESLSDVQRVLVIGSFLRKDHPLFAQRLRQAARKGARIHSLQAVHDDWLMPIATKLTTAPSGWVRALAEVAAAVASAKGLSAPADVAVSPEAVAIAESLLGGERKAILLGNAAVQHPQAAQLKSLANWIAEHTGASAGDLTEAANTVGAQLVRAQPISGGLHAAAMLQGSLKACLLLNVEPDRDAAQPAAAMAALQSAEMVVAFTSFRDASIDCADVLLPISPFTETSGTFVNAEGRAQSFHGVVKPLGETRPAWKVLRVLGNLLDLPGFDFETSEAVRAEALGDLDSIPGRLHNGLAQTVTLVEPVTGLERVSDVPIYQTDALVRRSDALQHTADACAPTVGVCRGTAAQMGLVDGTLVRVSQGEWATELPVRVDPTLAARAVRVSAGTVSSRSLGAMFGPVTLAKV
jgi:NADH-quinone oxidoreductase subunit G